MQPAQRRDKRKEKDEGATGEVEHGRWETGEGRGTMVNRARRAGRGSAFRYHRVSVTPATSAVTLAYGSVQHKTPELLL